VGLIFMLTLRQLSGKWRLIIIVLLSVLPVITSLVKPDDAPLSEMDDVLVNGMLASAILPIVVLSVATASLGNELEDKTLGFLMLNPLPRWQIVVPKLLGAIAVAAPALMIGGMVAAYIAFDGDGKAVVAVGIALLVGIATYASVFLWAGLMTSRALAFGLLYVFLWEGLFSNFVSGIRFLSIREYTIGIVRVVDGNRFAGADQETLSTATAIGGVLIVLVVFLLLSVRRLQRMDVP
jgi:ABC-2 type transport system permease protein